MEAQSLEEKVAILESRMADLTREVLINRERVKLLSDLFKLAGTQKSCDASLQIFQEGAQQLTHTLSGGAWETMMKAALKIPAELPPLPQPPLPPVPPAT